MASMMSTTSHDDDERKEDDNNNNNNNNSYDNNIIYNNDDDIEPLPSKPTMNTTLGFSHPVFARIQKKWFNLTILWTCKSYTRCRWRKND